MHWILTGCKQSRLSRTHGVGLLRVQSHCVFGIWLQVEEGVLGEAGRQVQLLGVGALNSEEETVAGNFGTGCKPQHHCTVLGHIGKMDVCGGIGL